MRRRGSDEGLKSGKGSSLDLEQQVVDSFIHLKVPVYTTNFDRYRRGAAYLNIHFTLKPLMWRGNPDEICAVFQRPAVVVDDFVSIASDHLPIMAMHNQVDSPVDRHRGDDAAESSANDNEVTMLVRI